MTDLSKSTLFPVIGSDHVVKLAGLKFTFANEKTHMNPAANVSDSPRAPPP